MQLQPHDVHIEFSAAARVLTVWDAAHEQIMSVEARNRTVLDDGNFGHWSPCPPGLFKLAAPRVMNTVPFGPFFVALLDFNGNHAMADHGRAGIGLHGGGTGLPDPFAARQGWQRTLGCIRMQNVDLRLLVARVQASQAAGGTCYITVVVPLPGSTAEETNDWGPEVELAPDE